MDERRTVTVLFCDVVGSTAITGQSNDPEEWAAIIRGAFPAMIGPVERYGGHVSRLLGDAILAMFGAPTSHEDDPRRAVLAGLEIVAAVAAYGERVRRDFGIDFKVRIGINTGLLVVGDFGAGTAIEYTAMGDAINIAAKIQEVAEPGTLLVTEETYRATSRFIKYEPQPPVEIKGRLEPVRAYRAIAALTEPLPPDQVGGLSTPMVGRDSQFRIIQEALANLRAGHGAIIAVIGEAGLGKTRLLAEARRHWLVEHGANSSLDQTWIEDRLASFESAQPYSLFRERLRIGFGLGDTSAGEGSPSAGNGHDDFSDEERSRAERVVQLLSSPASDPQLAGQFEGDALRRELVDLTVRVWQAWTARFGPSVYAIDDLHWVDPASSELLEALVPRLSDLPILVLLAFRPEWTSPATQVSRRFADRFPDRYREVTLERLPDEQLQALVSAILAVESLPQTLGTAVLARAEGNPLFVEELVRSLVEQGIIMLEPGGARISPLVSIEAVVLPDTLRGLLQGRIDRLDPQVRMTLQHAAVIGRTFSHAVLADVAPDPERLDSDIDALLEAGLIERANGEYSFRHALIWEVARDVPTRRQRRQLHRKVGEAVERLYKDRIDEHIGLLGYHFHAAGDERAIEYARRAGNQALEVYAPAEALRHFDRAIDVAERHMKTDVMFELYRQRGRAYEILGNFDRALRDLERALEVANDAGDVVCEWDSLLALGMLWSERDYERTLDYFQRANDLASNQGDQLMIARSLNRLGNWYLNADQPEQGLQYHQKALEIFRAHGNRTGLSETLDLLGMLHTLSGDAIAATDSYRQAAALFREMDERAGLASTLITLSLRSATLQSDHLVNHPDPLDVSRKDVEEALAITREIGWRAGESYALWALGFLLAARGLHDSAFESAEAGLAVATEIEHRQWMSASECAIGATYLDLLAWEEAADHLREALELAKGTGSRHWIGSATGFLAQALVAGGDLDRAHDVLVTVPSERRTYLTVAQRHVCCALVELYLAQGHPEDAFDLVSEVIELTPHKTERPIIRLAYLRGQARLVLGDPQQASDELGEALDVATRQGAAGMMWRIHAALARAAAMMDEPSILNQEREAARTIQERIAAGINDASLRQQFLKRAGQWLEPSPE